MNKRSSSALDARSVIIAVVVLLLGLGVGFAGGYKYEHGKAPKTKTVAAVKVKPKPKPAKTATTKPAASPQDRAELVTCLAGKGVKYPDPATANFNTPPAGVDAQTLSHALGACYGQLAKRPG